MDLKERPAEDAARHPWEEARFDHFRRLLEGSGAVRERVDVLDVGAGDGWFAGRMLERLPAGSMVTCWDLNYDDDAVEALPPGVEAIRDAPTGRTYGLVTLLDVLGHVEDDAGMLAGIVESHLAPGGFALVSVPAWPSLFTSHDTGLGHHRRYRPARGVALVRGAGLEVLLTGGLFTSLLVPRALQALRERWSRPVAVLPPPPLVWRAGAAAGAVVGAILRLDALVGRLSARLGVNLPGLSWWALCRRPAR